MRFAFWSRRSSRGRRGGLPVAGGLSSSRAPALVGVLVGALAAIVGGGSGSRPAHAGGMFASPHGARPLGRGGAFVAGADDLNAIYYNPAGVAALDLVDAQSESGWSGLLDLGFVLQNVAYTRNENGIMRPTVYSDSGLLGSAPFSIPQIAFARKLRRSWGAMAFGFGVWIPYTGLLRYPEPSYGSEQEIQQAPDVAPQRYQLIGLHDGSLAKTTLLAVLNPVASFSLLGDKLQLGIGPQLMIVYFRSKLMLSGCTQVQCRPEQPDFDTLVLAQAFAVVPSANLGALYRPSPYVRLGLSFQLPFFIRSAKGTVDTRLPPNELFNGATVSGRDAALAMNLPPILRVGAELYPLPKDRNRLRIELAYTAEFWSLQQDVQFIPQGISIENIKGLGSYELGPVALRRDMQTVHAVHLGLEGTIYKFLGARLGGMFETNSMPDATVTVLTPDYYKGLISVGLFAQKIRFGKTEWRFDLSYGRIIQPDRTVRPEDSLVYPSNPIRPEPTSPPGVYGIGGGLYQVSYDIIAFGLSAVRL